jgi:hypothetical protein
VNVTDSDDVKAAKNRNSSNIALGYENRMEWDDQLCFSEFVCACFALPASRPDLESAAAVDLLVASKRTRPLSPPGNAMGQDFRELNRLRGK